MNDNPESVISVACFMVDIYPVLVKIVVLTLSSKLRVSVIFQLWQSATARCI